MNYIKIDNRFKWSEKKIETAEPGALLEYIKEYVTHLNADIAKNRQKLVKPDEFKIYLEEFLEKRWGPWSHQLNVIVRRRAKEADLFIENDNQRFLAKQLTTVHLYWNKNHRYLESLFVENVIGNTTNIAQKLFEVEQAYQFFHTLKKVSTPIMLGDQNE